MVDLALLLFLVGVMIAVFLHGAFLKKHWEVIARQTLLGFFLMVLAGVAIDLLDVGFRGNEWSFRIAVSVVVSASIQEIFRFGNTFAAFRKWSLGTELCACGGAAGFGMGIAEFVLALLNRDPFATMELVTAVLMLTMIGIGSVYGFEIVAFRTRQNPPIAIVALTGLLPAAAAHAGMNVAVGVYVLSKPNQARSLLASLFVVVASFAFMKIMTVVARRSTRSSENGDR